MAKPTKKSPKAVKKETKVVKKTVEKIKAVEEETPVVEIQDFVEETVETPTEQPEAIDLWSQVMTNKNKSRQENVEVKPTVVDTKAWKIHVISKFNHWSFAQWKEYRVSTKVFQNYQGILEVIE
jgi:hypothetical protein